LLCYLFVRKQFILYNNSFDKKEEKRDLVEKVTYLWTSFIDLLPQHFNITHMIYHLEYIPLNGEFITTCFMYLHILEK